MSRQEYDVGDRVLVSRDPGLAPAIAEIRASNRHRPHLIKVRYVSSGTGAWIARARIVGPAPPAEWTRS